MQSFPGFCFNVLPETILEYYVSSIQSSVFPKTRPQEIIIGRKTSKNQSKKDQDFQKMWNKRQPKTKTPCFKIIISIYLLKVEPSCFSHTKAN